MQGERKLDTAQTCLSARRPAYHWAVRTVPPIDSELFVKLLKPLLEKHDLQALVLTVRAHWELDQVVSILSGPSQDARKVALLTLSCIGDKSCILPLMKQLKDQDEVVYGMAEHALWSVFFRSGTCSANHEVCRGTKLLDAGRFDDAEKHFTRAIEIDSTFAEAFNQRAVAHYLRDNYKASIDDCDEAIERMPCHFGAWSGKGHALLQLGQLHDAADCYRKAVEIHPHLDCVRETLAEIDFRLKLMDEDEAAGNQ